MVGRERLDPVLATRHRLARLELDEADRIGQPPDERPKLLEELAQPARAVDPKRRFLAPTERERLEHAREAEEMIRVVVREEDLLEIRQADGRALELSLRPLAAVEEKPIAAAADEHGCRAALRGR